MFAPAKHQKKINYFLNFSLSFKESDCFVPKTNALLIVKCEPEFQCAVFGLDLVTLVVFADVINLLYLKQARLFKLALMLMQK